MKIQIDLTGIQLETERLILRPFRKPDLEDFYAYASVPGVGEMAGWLHHESMEDTEKILSMFMEEKNVWALELKESGRVIGSFGFHGSWANKDERYRDCRICEIGYVLSKDYWGRGLMPEAVKAALRFAFDTLRLDGVTVCHFTDNHQSRRVIEKSGFTFCQKDFFQLKYDTRQVEEMQYILLRPEGKWMEEAGEKKAIAQTVLSSLPDWFGIEEAAREYIEKSAEMPFYAVFSGTQPIGFAALLRHFEMSAEIYVMGLDSRFHRMGLGAGMINALKQYCRDRGIQYLQVKTLDQSAGSPQYDCTRAFYLAQDFQPLECLPKLWDPGNPCLIMIQKIN